VDAQDNFKAMLREYVAPRLRELGFKGSGATYSRPSEVAWLLLGFQKFKWSTEKEVEFTLNLTVAPKDAWAKARSEREWLPDRPSANTFYGTYIWQVRIGDLLGGGDRMWRVQKGQPTDAVAADVLEVIERYALPAMQAKLAEFGGVT
jgi:hypothetical protein